MDSVFAFLRTRPRNCLTPDGLSSQVGTAPRAVLCVSASSSRYPLTANPSRLRRAGRVRTASRPSLPRVGTRRRRVRPRPSSPHPHGRDTVAPVGMTGPVILGRAGRAPLPRNKKAGDQGIYPPAPGPRFSLPEPTCHRAHMPPRGHAPLPPCHRSHETLATSSRW